MKYYFVSAIWIWDLIKIYLTISGEITITKYIKNKMGDFLQSELEKAQQCLLETYELAESYGDNGICCLDAKNSCVHWI